MIVAANSKPSIVEFRDLMTKIDVALNSDALARPAYYAGRNGTQLETDVRDAAIDCAINTKFEGTIQLVSGKSFPDIVAAKYYGIEVKSTLSNKWTSVGGSILESTRISDVERIFLTFGKLADPIEFMSRPYEECLADIAVTHYPRYMIDMTLRDGETIFDKMGVPYDTLRSMENPVEPVAEYYRARLRPGESLWWAGNKVDTVVPATVCMWRSISSAEKDKLEAMIYFYFPESIMSRGQFKYDRPTLWLATQKGIINSNVRDSYSSGGQERMRTMDGKLVYMPAIFRKISEHIEQLADVIKNTPTELLAENWGCSVERDRVRQWINLVISSTPHTEEKIIAKSVLERIFTDNGLL